MKIIKKQCEICGKEVNIFRVNDPNSPFHQKLDSEEAIFYEKNWFCNNCWKEMMNNISPKLDKILEEYSKKEK